MEILAPRLVLRDFVDADVEAVAAYQADPRYHTFYGPGEVTAAQARALVERFRIWAAERPRRRFQLAVVREGAVVGCVGLRGEGLGRAELGIELAPAVWGRGYAAEAARAMLAFGFETLGLAEVRAETVSGNARVARLLRGLGFVEVDRRDGDAWMTERGWRHVSWRLSRP